MNGCSLVVLQQGAHVAAALAVHAAKENTISVLAAELLLLLLKLVIWRFRSATAKTSLMLLMMLIQSGYVLEVGDLLLLLLHEDLIVLRCHRRAVHLVHVVEGMLTIRRCRMTQTTCVESAC